MKYNLRISKVDYISERERTEILEDSLESMANIFQSTSCMSRRSIKIVRGQG